jgi:hypothetical protein
MENVTRKKYFVFSDESGSWHDSSDIYVRAWIVVPESEHAKLVDSVSYILSELNCRELKWSHIANNMRHVDFTTKFNHRIFLTVTCPAEIKWEQKYRITRDFSAQVENFDFGQLDLNLVTLLKKKMFDDIRNVLFLKFYEKTHIENAKQAIDSVLPAQANELIYRIDSPQMSKDEWKNILLSISPGVQVEFPKAQSTEGIQVAGIVAGCIRSFLVSDSHLESANLFIPKIRSRFVKKSKANPNPNLIFFNEIKASFKSRGAEIWTVGS